MDKQKKRQYEAPDLTSVTFKNERGYAVSMTFNALAHDAHVAENEFMEAERTSYGWTDANNVSWF